MTCQETQLNPYELKIVESLVPEYGKERAVETVTAYRAPLRELGGSYGPEDVAESLLKIVKKGIGPEEWLAHMKKLDVYLPANRKTKMNETRPVRSYKIVVSNEYSSSKIAGTLGHVGVKAQKSNHRA